jgi:arylsulfatase A-like enzyme
MIRVGRCAAVVLLLLTVSCDPRELRGARPNLLLISVDTLRADHLGSYGYRLDTSPTIDALAAAGVRFADATVQWPKTWPSMASMLTGRYPASAGVRYAPRRPVSAEQTTLAEVLRGAGYATAAVVANPNVGRELAFDQGFDRFVESWLTELKRQTGAKRLEDAPGAVKHFTNATIVTDEAVRFLDSLAAGPPFFLWLHYIDPHGPYRPPREYRRLFFGDHAAKPVPLAELPPYQVQVDRERGVMSGDLGFYIGQYDREIRYLDDQLARLLAKLDALGLRENTLIVLTADHGESLDEHGYYLEHGKAPFQPTAHVPLIFALPGRVPAGRAVTEPVALVDLVPTVLELLDVPAPPGLQGRSLVPAWQGGASSPYVFMEAGTRTPSQLVIRKGPWKLVRFRAREDRERFARNGVELYDLSQDPGERRDVRSEHPEVARELEEALARWVATTPEYRPSKGEQPPRVDERTRQMLKGLGYIE